MKLVVATKNAHKRKEVAALLAPLGFEVEESAEWSEVEEDAATFDANAEKKARAACEATGIASLADDSGLEVDALDGAPGVRSARYAGGMGHDDAANNRKLLTALAEVPDAPRSARFRCALVLIETDGNVIRAEGTCEGRILSAPRGTGGFGYDPLFWVNDLGKGMAELTMEEKNRVSHRARAFAALAKQLKR